MKTISYLSVFLVILIKLVDGSSISCLGGKCKPEETVTTVVTANKTGRTTSTNASATPEETTVQSTTVPSTTTLSTEWPPRRIVCPPYDPFENVFHLFRTSSLKTTNVPTLRAKPTKLVSPEFLNRLLKISKSHRRRRPTNIPTQDATDVLPTTSRQTSTDVPSAQSTTKIPHVLLN